jgi:hypothetical protein
MNFENKKPAAIIRLYCNSALFFISVCEVKPPSEDKDGKFYESFTKAMEPFNIGDKIISIGKVEDAIIEMNKIRADPFIWFIIALSFMYYYFGNCPFNLMFGYNQKAILKLSIQYVKDNIVKDSYSYLIYLDGDIINEKGEKLPEKETVKFKKKDFSDLIDKENLSKIRRPIDFNVTEVLHAMNMLYRVDNAIEDL